MLKTINNSVLKLFHVGLNSVLRYGRQYFGTSMIENYKVVLKQVGNILVEV